MAQVIVYPNSNGGVVVCIPTPEYLQDHTVEDVLAKDCPDYAIIMDEADLPQGDDNNYFDAWELVDGVVVVNQAKKDAIIAERQAPILAKQSALAKLMALGLTEEEALALGVK